MDAKEASGSLEGWDVPHCEVVEFHVRRTRYCLCIPVINEGARITTQLRGMGDLRNVIDIVIADGGSSDGSTCTGTLQALGVRALLVKQGPGRLSAQMRMGLAYALLQGYEGIVTMDGNNKDDPEAIPQFMRALDEGMDHVQGSRFMAGGVAVNTPWIRVLAIRLIHAPLLSLAAGVHFTDTTNGFRAYSRKFLLDPAVAPFRNVFSGYELHYYLAVRASRLGYQVRELPVTRRYPNRGPVPTRIVGVNGNLEVLYALLSACLHRFNPPRSSPSRSGPSGNG